MSRKTVILLLLLVGLGFSFCSTSCSLFPLSIDGRITQFIADLNQIDRSVVYENFHPTIAQYDAIKDPNFWDVTYFPFTYAQYHITALDTSDPLNVTGTITADGAWSDKDVRFVMMQSGNDWLISEMWMDPSPGPVVTQIVW